MTFEEFLDRAAHLRRDVSRGQPMPYKPLLLATVVVLIHKGTITSRHVLLDGGVKSAFRQLLRAVYPSWPYDAKAQYPYRHLENDGIWRLEALPGAEGELAAARAGHLEAWDVLRHVRCATLDENVFATLASSPTARAQLVQLLCRTYLPAGSDGIIAGYLGIAEHASEAAAQELVEVPFTEKVLEEHLERHWSRTPFATMGVELAQLEKHGIAGRQVLTEVNAIDLLGYQEPNRCWWVFELKRGRPGDAVVGQVGRYLTWVRKRFAPQGDDAVGVVIARDADTKLRYSVQSQPGVSLWLYDDTLSLRRAPL